MNYTCDVVVIGSGAGGGTVAQRLAPLARQGAKILLLEAGPHFPQSYFTQREVEMMDLFWFGGAWPTDDKALTLAAGKGVGGSTLVYTGVTFRITPEIIDDWRVPGITVEDLTKRFERIETEIQVATPDEEMVNDNNRLFREGCERLGWPVKKLRLNLKNCKQTGFCNLGCSKGAKQGTLQVQIPKARAAGVELIPNCVVDNIHGQVIQATVHPTPQGTIQGPWPAGSVQIQAKRIVLAAGSPGSPAILLRSGLKRELPFLGHYLTLHPALTVYGLYPTPIKNYRGFPKTFYTDQFVNSHHHMIETAFYYPFVTTKHLGLWGPDLKRVMRAYNRMMTILILNHDTARAENQIKIKRHGDIRLCYELSPASIDSLCHAQIQAAQIFFAAGCKEVIMPFANPMIIDGQAQDTLSDLITTKNHIPNKTPLSSAHPQGGCRMGSDRQDSVTDSWGQVHDHPELWVADASLFPKSAQVNPYLTVMALADRVAERLLATSSEWL